MKLKHLILSAAFSGLALMSFAQSMKVESAIGYISDYTKYNEIRDLDEAIKAATAASNHEKTGNEARTWYYVGLTHQLMFQDSIRSAAEKPRDLLVTAINAYVKAANIDAEGDKKRDLDNNLKAQLPRNLLAAARQVYGQGVQEYQGKEYEAALKSFEASASVYRLPSMKAQTDTNAFNNAAVSAAAANKYDVAIKYYDELIGMGYKPGEMYYLKAQAYKNMGQDDKYEATIKEGREKHPSDNILITEELNMALKAGKNDQALNNLKLAVEKDPNNKVLQYNLGTIYYNLGDYDNLKGRSPYDETYVDIMKNSEAAFKKAIEIDSEYFDAHYNLGALYINHAKLIQAYADEMTDDKAYNEESAKAQEWYDKSIPSLEKALELNPDDYNTLSALKDLYLYKGEMDKFKVINEKLQQK